MRAILFIVLFIVSLTLLLHAQVQDPAINQGAAAAYNSLLRLRTTATVLHTTAHPDDEDGGLITWLSRSQGVRTGLFTLNRGEGGANLIGSELFDGLGVVRTEELLAANRYYGVDQFFTRVTDFGFSKRLDETLEHWGRENVLRDCVRVIRLYRPDVLVSRFVGGPRDGHGNHETAGVMSKEVFSAAADPTRFPEHFKEGLRPWQIRKLYQSARGAVGGAVDRAPDGPLLTIDIGAYDPLLTQSYRQLAAAGLAYQRSQGTGGRRADPGRSLSSVVLIQTALSAKPEKEQTLFDGLDTSLAGLAKLAPSLGLDAQLGEIERHVNQAILAFDAREPWKVVTPHIAPGLRVIRELITRVREAAIPEDSKYDLMFRLNNKEREFVDAANKCLGMYIEVLVDASARGSREPAANPFARPESFRVAIPEQKFTLTATVVNRGGVEIHPSDIALQVPGGWQSTRTASDLKPLGNNGVSKTQFEITVAENAAFTRPYWSRQDQYREHLYQVDKPEYANLPWAPPDVTARFYYSVSGVAISLNAPAQVAYTERPLGERRRLLMVAPAMSVAITPQNGVIPVAARNTPVNVRVRVMSNAKSAAEAKVRLELPSGWVAAPAVSAASFTHEGEIQNLDFRVTVPMVEKGKSYAVKAVAEYNGRQYREGYQTIAHNDLEPRHVYRPASAVLSGIDVKVAPGLNVGYIMGVGDEIPESLEQIGIRTQMLTAQDLAAGNLARFDTILVGIRASAVRADYKAFNARLMEYVKNGGNLVVQYQTQEFDQISYGPYPFRLGNRAEEVSEETAKLTMLDPQNPIFQGPNKITPEDFDNWVEERGSKFMSEWDPKYTALLESHDRDQEPQKGGMLQAKFGKGTFTYAAYAFYRQLPAGVPGATRLFANIVSLGKAGK